MSRVDSFLHRGQRLEFSEFGSGDRWVILIHGALMPRRMQEPLARHLVEHGAHVVTLDLLGHGTSDKPGDMLFYGMLAFADQVEALMDHLGIERAVVGGTSLGANVALEFADAYPERVQGLLLEMPVLDNAIEFGIVFFAPLLFATRIPFVVRGVSLASRAVPRRIVPFWPSILLDTLDQDPAGMRAALKGMFFGRIAPQARYRKRIEAPALVIGHPRDPVHPFGDADMLATEIRDADFLAARGILEWRLDPDRLNAAAVDFVERCYGSTPEGRVTPIRRSSS